MRSRSYVGHARRMFEEWELDELLGASNPRDRVFWLLGADSGLRHAEIEAFRPGDLAGRRIRVLGKGNKVRWTVATARLIEAISGTDYWRRKPMSYRGIWGAFLRDRARAGLPEDLVMHSLRHRFATRLLRQGVNLVDIQSLLGHSDLKTTCIYLQDDPDRFDRAVQALEGRVIPRDLEASHDLLLRREW